MTIAIALAVAVMMMVGTSVYGQESRRAASTGGKPKILIAYFSKTNNTGTVAGHIQSLVGGDLFQVAAKKPYPADYRETTRVAREELDNDERPELAAALSAEDMEKYDVIFLGYPIWWGTFPMAMFTFLERYDLSGKTIVPFCTHERSGIARSPADIEKLCPDSTVLRGLAVRGGAVGSARNDVADWLRRLGYIE